MSLLKMVCKWSEHSFGDAVAPEVGNAKKITFH
jgi:hypothetical protein